MANQPFFPSREGDQIPWFTNLQTKTPAYYTALDISAARQTKLQLTLAWLIWAWQTYMPTRRAEGPAATTWRNLLANGTSDATTVTTPPAPVALTTPAGAPYFGMLSWLFDEIARWKKAEGYLDAIGEDLDIIGAVQSAIDLTTVKPVLELSLNGNRVEIGWGWQNMKQALEGCEIQVDRGDGKGFVFLVHDTTPDYTDTTPFPTAPVKWSYRAIYHADDHQVGLWSDPVSITVGG